MTRPHRLLALSVLSGATLLTLAVIEHWFLVLPVPAEAMWNWALGGRATKNADDIKKTSAPTTLARSATR